MKRQKKTILILSFLLAQTSLHSALADTEAGRLAVVNGEVTIAKDEKSAGTPAKPNDLVQNDDVIKTAGNASVKILFTDQSIMDLGPNTAFKVSDYALKDGDNRTGSYNLLYGKLRALVTNKVGPGGRVEVKSAGTVMGVRGTEFVVDTPKSTLAGATAAPTVTVVTGIVQVRSPSGQSFSVTAGQMATTGSSVAASASTKSETSSSTSANGDAAKADSGPVQQVSNDQMQQTLGGAKTEDKTFSNSINMSASEGGGGGQSRATLAQVGSVVSNVNVPPPASETGVQLNIIPTNTTQMNSFLPPVSIVPGNLVNVSISVQ